jgi:hypothetical protein
MIVAAGLFREITLSLYKLLAYGDLFPLFGTMATGAMLYCIVDYFVFDLLDDAGLWEAVRPWLPFQSRRKD